MSNYPGGVLEATIYFGLFSRSVISLPESCRLDASSESPTQQLRAECTHDTNVLIFFHHSAPKEGILHASSCTTHAGVSESSLQIERATVQDASALNPGDVLVWFPTRPQQAKTAGGFIQAGFENLHNNMSDRERIFDKGFKWDQKHFPFRSNSFARMHLGKLCKRQTQVSNGCSGPAGHAQAHKGFRRPSSHFGPQNTASDPQELFWLSENSGFQIRFGDPL